MKHFKLCYFSPHSIEIPSLGNAVRRYRDQVGDISVTARTSTQLFDSLRMKAFIAEAISSDAVIISLHGGKASCPAFDELIKAMNTLPKAPYFHVQPVDGDEDAIAIAREFCPSFGTEEWDTINKYLVYGGNANLYNMLVYLSNIVLDSDVPAALPQKVPQEGIYHPDFPYVPSIDEYAEKKIDPRKPTIGIWFYQTYWLNANLADIDAMIREIEERGANVISVFHMRFRDADRGNKGAASIAEKFFIKGGRPIIDVLISPMMFSLTMTAPDHKKILPKLGVPYIQTISSWTSYEEWKNSAQGVATMDIAYSVAQPEFDGALITVPTATREESEIDPITGALVVRNAPINERISKVVSLALNWAKLRRKKNNEKRIAIVLHNHPPRNDRIGCAAGLDSFESVKLLLDRMKEEGYLIEKTYRDGNELANEILHRLTYDGRWLTPEKMAEKAEASADERLYRRWHDSLSDHVKDKMKEDWGEAPGELFVHNGRMFFPGIINGNIFITVQPPRGWLESAEAIYHDLHLSPPHNYLGHYRWMREVFHADAVIHVGKHGSLEWLPGKAVGLSNECYPDLAIMDIPNLYPYIINDPGEGTQAKRRSYCCIVDHLTPVFTNADLYEDLAKIENLLKEYADAVNEDPAKIKILQSMIWEAVCEANLDKDLEVTKEEACANFDSFLKRLHNYLGELADTMINDGLHILGTPPEGERLVEFVTQLTRLANGSVPSLRESVLSAMGYRYDELLEDNGSNGWEAIHRGHKICLQLIRELQSRNFDVKAIEEVTRKVLNVEDKQVAFTLKYICDTLFPNIKRSAQEMDSVLIGLRGGFVPPGPSGAPTRGQADILPTGRNFYSVAPNKIPTPSAWEMGKKLGDALLERYLQEAGEYPESVGIVIWGTGTMRTRGDDVAEVLYLLGVKPVWAKGSGNVVGLEIIPSSELKRPRIDVTLRISGFFRDSFPNLVELIDEAIRMVVSLNEPTMMNRVRQNVLQDMEDYKKAGMSEEEAFRNATLRIFGCPPGTYGAGVAELIESKNWKTQEDLANTYIHYSSHAYGKGIYGEQRPEAFKRALSRMDVTVKNEDSREYDMMSCTDYYNYYGGLIAAAEIIQGKLPLALMGDSSEPAHIKMRTTSEEAKHILRSRLVNPKWLDGMKRHGYKGAGDISHMVDIVFGWDATAEVIDDWMYEKIARKTVFDKKIREWMKKVNPYALQSIVERFLEAINRGMWNTENKVEEELKNIYLELEGEIEEITDHGSRSTNL